MPSVAAQRAADARRARPANDAGAESCRGCGCSEFHACYRPDQGSCWWVAPRLCSHCAQPWRTRRRLFRAFLWASLAAALGAIVAYAAILCQLQGYL